MISPSSYLVCMRNRTPRPAEHILELWLWLLSWSSLVSFMKLALKCYSFYFCLQWYGWKVKEEDQTKLKTLERWKTISHLRKSAKGWRINLHLFTQLWEESKLLVQCFHPWWTLQHIEKIIFCLFSWIQKFWGCNAKW